MTTAQNQIAIDDLSSTNKFRTIAADAAARRPEPLAVPAELRPPQRVEERDDHQWFRGGFQDLSQNLDPLPHVAEHQDVMDDDPGMPPPLYPTLKPVVHQDVPDELNAWQAKELRKLRLKEKREQLDNNFSRWIEDLFSDIPNVGVSDAHGWTEKRIGKKRWFGIRGAVSMDVVGGTEFVISNIIFTVRGQVKVKANRKMQLDNGYTVLRGALYDTWQPLDNDDMIDAANVKDLWYGCYDVDGNFQPIDNLRHLGELILAGRI